MSGSGGWWKRRGGGGKWVMVDHRSSLPPTASMKRQSSKPFSWRISGAGILVVTLRRPAPSKSTDSSEADGRGTLSCLQYEKRQPH